MGNKSNVPIYWSLLTHGDWNLHIAAAAEGLCFVGSQNQPFEELAEWAAIRSLSRTLIREDEKLQPPIRLSLLNICRGHVIAFTFPYSFHGTPFQVAVWKALCDIPYGQTKSYSDIAHHIQNPASVRAVGAAIGANPILITVPCHRVIGKNGALTGYRGGLDMKTKLLQLERDGAHTGGDLRHA